MYRQYFSPRFIGERYMSKWLQCLACTFCCKTWDLHVPSAGKNLDGISHSQWLPTVTLAGWAIKLAVLFQLSCWESQSQASPFWASVTLPNLTYPSQLVFLASVSFLALWAHQRLVLPQHDMLPRWYRGTAASSSTASSCCPAAAVMSPASGCNHSGISASRALMGGLKS